MTYTAFIYALRNLKRNKLSSLINIFGFSIGIAAFLLIVSYIKFEKENDSFYENVDNIYRIGINFINNHDTVENAMVQFPVASVLKEEYAEVEEYARMWGNYNITVKFEDQQFYESKIYNVDASFPKMFCEMVVGNSIDCLTGENNVIVSEEIAEKYFGSDNPLGKNIEVSGYGIHKVTGVFKNRTKKSHFDFEILLPIHQIVKDFKGNWGSHNFYTYVNLKKGTDPGQFTEKVNNMINQRYASNLYSKTGIKEEMFLVPIDEIRLHTDSLMDFKQNGYGYYIPFFILTAIIIIVFAMFNYFNFASSQAVEKSKTIGINRALGAGKRTIFKLFLIESFVFIFISTCIGAILALLLFPTFSQFYGVTYEYSLLTSGWFWLAIILIITITTIVSGIYPAILSLSFKISEVVRGRGKVNHSGVKVIKILTVLQYTVSCLLIIFSLVSYNQIEYMRDYNLGFEKENVVVARGPVILKGNLTHQRTYPLLKNSLDKIPEIKDISFSDYVPGGNYERFDRVKLVGKDDIFETFMNNVSFNYIDFFKIKLLAGRNFSRTRLADYNESIIINKKLADMFGYTPEEAIDKQVDFDGKKKIIGVIDDFHQESLKKETAPFLFYQTDWPDYFCFKVSENNLTATINKIEQAWVSIFPDNPFNYFFLDKYFDQNYVKDNKAWQILRLYSGLAIIIAILGLLGAIVHQVKQRRKEIAMYKVLGADKWYILWRFLKSTLYLVVISFLIGLPIQVFILKEWLSAFPYRISLNVMHFLTPLTILVLITFITISTQVFRVISMNLVSSLRSE